jgi:YHS domain-containing protein
MRNNRLTIALSFGIAIGTGLSLGLAGHDDPPAKSGPDKVELPRCPVMDEPVDFNVSTATDKGPVYFCCSMCIGKYKKDPEKYAKGVGTQRSAVAKLARVQVTCPVSNKPVNKDVTAKHNGQNVHFCCDRCPAVFAKDPARFEKKLAESYTYQTKCPVSGKPIDPSASIEIKGRKIYFCCDKCDEAFMKEPAKYVGNLTAQGYPIEADDVKAAGGQPKKPVRSAPNM